MKLPFRRLFTVAAAVAALAAFASAQEPASSPPPKSKTDVSQKTGATIKITGGTAYGLGPLEKSIPDIVRASQVTEVMTVVVVFGCPVLIVALVVFGRYRRAQIMHQTLRVMVEKGAAIPPELLVPPKPPANDFRRGVLLISLGVGLIGLLPMHSSKGIWALGFVPLLLGVGYLVAARLGTKPPAGPGPTLPS
jgi:hypothetical protein